jgi:hypothetical protein
VVGDRALAGELGKLPNKVSIEGHTDAKPFTKVGNYGNWELSADRANAARYNGMAPGQVVQIRGYADQQLGKKDSPEDPSNRRITVIVQYTPKGDAGADAENGSEPPKDAEAPKGGEAAKSAEQLGFDDLQIVSDAEHAGNGFGANPGGVLVGFVIDYPFQTHIAPLHDDADGLLHSHGIFLQAGKAVDGTVETTAKLIVHG